MQSASTAYVAGGGSSDTPGNATLVNAMKVGKSGSIAWMRPSAAGMNAHRVRPAVALTQRSRARRAPRSGARRRPRPCARVRSRPSRGAAPDRPKCSARPATASARRPGKTANASPSKPLLPPAIPTRLSVAVALERDDRNAGGRGRFVRRSGLTENERNASQQRPERAAPRAHELASVTAQDKRHRLARRCANLPARASRVAREALRIEPARNREARRRAPER